MKNYTRTTLPRQSGTPLTLNRNHKLDYPTKKKRIWQAAGGSRALNPLELRAILAQIPPPQHDDHWGDWRFNGKNFTLTYDTDHGWFEVDLERMTDPARMLDTILRFSTKPWAPREAVGDLVEALNDLLNPQSTLCSWGQPKHLDATKHLEELLAGTSILDRPSTERPFVDFFVLATDHNPQKRSHA